MNSKVFLLTLSTEKLHGKVPEDWRKANVTPIFKKGKMEEPGNYGPASVPGEMTEQILETISRHIKDRTGIRKEWSASIGQGKVTLDPPDNPIQWKNWLGS
ncbi:hypothetical protein BTVI_20651 [Pitangus sulphuratus]|nr:hypothetical protein BTVI_20651 [Pitangus sulphuratus]